MNKLITILFLSTFSLCPSLILAQWTRVGGELQGADYYLVAFRFLNRSANEIHAEEGEHLLTCNNIILNVGRSSSNPIVEYHYRFIYDSDTMWISFKHSPSKNYFIDSIIFTSGVFEVQLGANYDVFSDCGVRDFFYSECIGSKLRSPRVVKYPEAKYELHPDIRLYYRWVLGLRVRERHAFE